MESEGVINHDGDSNVEQISKVNDLDSEWYERFSEHGRFEAYEYFDGDKDYRNAHREVFFRGEIENPTLDYPKLDIAKLQERESELLRLKRDLLMKETNKIVREAYRPKLNEKIAELRMLQAASIGDMRRFRRYSEFIYGKPSNNVFAYTVNELKKQANNVIEEASNKSYEEMGIDYQELSSTAEELIRILPDMPEVTIAELPDDKTIQTAKETTLNEFGNIITLPEADTTYKPEDLLNVFSEAIEEMELQGWTVIEDDSSATAIRASQESKEVKVPRSDRSFDSLKVQQLIVHELGTHAKRRDRGERSRLMLLGLGLDRYEGGEEGVATMREQTIVGKVDEFAGFVGHLSIGLAYGLDGSPRDFRQVFEITKLYYKMKGLLAGKTKEKAERYADLNAWNRTVRTFRGTDSATPGVAFTKDIVYREGNIAVWNIVKKNPEEMMRFSVGKYDPSNPRHIWILDQLGITDTDLEELIN